MRMSMIAKLAGIALGLGLLTAPASAGGYGRHWGYDDNYRYPGYGCCFGCCSYYGHRYRGYYYDNDYRYRYYARRYRSFYDDYGYSHRYHHRHHHHRHCGHRRYDRGYHDD